MGRAFWKAGLSSLAVVLFSVTVTCGIAVVWGSGPGIFGLGLSAGIPLVTAFPSLTFIFLQHDRLREAHAQLARAHEELQARSRIDHMTGLLNRETFFEAMKVMRSRVENGTLLVIDADHFKAINDTFGHSTGDHALKLIAFALQNVTRKGDLVGRIGGEEFCIFLPGAGSETGMKLAQRMRAEVQNIAFQTNDRRVWPLTISIGLAHAQKSESTSQAFSRADRALYLAKKRGRNCIVVSDGNELPGSADIVPFAVGREKSSG